MPWASRGLAARDGGRPARAGPSPPGRLPLGAVGEPAGAAHTIEGDDGGGHAVEQEAIVGHQHQGAGELGEAVLEHLQRGDVEIVGGLVEEQEVGRLEHEPGDECTRARSPPDSRETGSAELLGSEEEALGPGGHVERATLIEDAIGLGRQRAAERLVRIERLAVLVEVRDAAAPAPARSRRGRASRCRRAGGAPWSCRCRSGR